jgi:hypothetical protein
MTTEAANGARVSAMEEGGVVCCGCSCRPSITAAPRGRRFRKLTTSISSRVFRLQKFYDAQQQPPTGDIVNWSGNDSNNDNDSLFFFDAEQDPLDESEYPVIFTDFLRHPKPKVSLEAPESMLRKVSFMEQEAEKRLLSASEHAATSAPSASGATKDFRRQYSAPIDHEATQRSQRFLRLVQRSTLEQEHELQAPRVKIPLQGYPGDLTVAELQECVRMDCCCYLFP